MKEAETSQNSISVGVDILEISRLEKTVERWGPRFYERIYTPQELVYSRGGIRELAARFCGKEAVMKALGTGVRVAWREIEIQNDPQGRPEVYLSGRAQRVAEAMGLGQVAISLSHSFDYALAVAVAMRI